MICILGVNSLSVFIDVGVSGIVIHQIQLVRHCCIPHIICQLFTAAQRISKCTKHILRIIIQILPRGTAGRHGISIHICAIGTCAGTRRLHDCQHIRQHVTVRRIFCTQESVFIRTIGNNVDSVKIISPTISGRRIVHHCRGRIVSKSYNGKHGQNHCHCKDC